MYQTKLVKEVNELRGTKVQLVDYIIKSQTLIYFDFFLFRKYDEHFGTWIVLVNKMSKPCLFLSNDQVLIRD